MIAYPKEGNKRNEEKAMTKVLLAENGKALLPILLPKDAEEGMMTAAEELRHYLNLITGAKFEITEGCCKCTGIHLLKDETMGEEEFRIQTTDKGMNITSGTLRGVFYGVYGLLEDVLGVRFYAHDVTVVPEQATLALEDLDLTEKPALEFRQEDNPLNMFPEWRAHNRLNGPDHNHVSAVRDGLNRFGGMKSYALFVHTFNALVPPAKYMEAHPEYYSMVDGIRISERAQLCLTNPEVLAIATESVKQTLREHPEATLISVSQNDWYNPCECPECAKVDAEEGSHAGTLIRFVNAIAEAIEPEFPNVVVDTLAYQYTRMPPKITKPRANVCVRLCSIECCFGHPLDTCNRIADAYVGRKGNSAASFQEDLIGWGKICDRIYIWDYVTDFSNYWLPFPNFQVLGPNMKFFVNNGVKGVYEEANYQSVSPDLSELRHWLMAKLMWNPDFDVEKGIYDFTEAVYGAAAPEIRAWMDMLKHNVVDKNIHFGINVGPDVAYLDADTVAKGQKLMAAALAKELTFSQRVYTEKAALTVEFTEVAQNILKGNVDEARIDHLLEKASSLGITLINEWVPWDVAHRGMLNGKLYR